MTAHTATVTEEGSDTVVRITGKVHLPQGPVLVRENQETGELVISPLPVSADPTTWAEFFEFLDTHEPDPNFMKERPMNRPPIEKNLFPDD